MMMKNPQTITLALTGASGMPYGIRLLERLLAADRQVYLLYSQVAQIVAQQEMNMSLPSRPQEAELFFNQLYHLPWELWPRLQQD